MELIGADIDAIQRGEDRLKFKEIVQSIGGDVPRSAVCHSMDEVRAAVAELGLPVVIRPRFTMGGLGSGMAHDDADLERLAGGGLAASPVHEVLIEESVLGWKEYELELMRDRHDNVVVVCSIENLDPMGVHTGDSITVAPAMTLTDREYQHMRDVGIAVLRAVGVDTGGCNIQFAVHPDTGRLVVIEMNPRVSRSSALASKATGFPIAKIAAKLAIGYTLDEIRNDITGETPAAFEPTLDYVVVKVPRFAFEKFPGADPELTTTMKSVGEAMALGRSFPEALGKALRSMETAAGSFWTTPGPGQASRTSRTPVDGRIYAVERALRGRRPVAEVAAASGIDPWFVDQIDALVALRAEILDAPVLDEALLRRAKRAGLSDRQLAALRPEFAGEDGVRTLRHRLGVRPVYKTVDTCAAEFAARTPYHYSAYETDPEAESEIAPQTERPKVLILGSGPNRIGQGIEFDYSCVHAVMALREAGFETVMVNCNPETVSTDYDTADRLYFEPLTLRGRARGGARRAGLRDGGRGDRAAGRADPARAGRAAHGRRGADRRHQRRRHRPGRAPRRVRRAAGQGEPAGARPSAPRCRSTRPARSPSGSATRCWSARPTCSAGAAWRSSTTSRRWPAYIARATTISPEHPVLVDRFLDDADRDRRGRPVRRCRGVHRRGDGAHRGGRRALRRLLVRAAADLAGPRRSWTRCAAAPTAIALGVGVRGLLNVQFALHGETLYVLEANPRASRTVPFVSKATAVPLAKAAARIMLGASIAELRAEGLLPATGDGGELPPDAPIAVKEAVLPFHRFRTREGKGVDSLLGPEMKSTGEVMGFDVSFGAAFAKSQAAAYGSLPTSGRVFVSIADRDKRAMVFPVLRLAALGFEVLATGGTADVLRRHGIETDGGAQALRGRRDDRGPDPGRRHRHDHQHPVRELRPAHRRLRDPLRRGLPRRAVHHDGAGRGGRGTGHRGDEGRPDRGALAAGRARGAAQGAPMSGRPGRPASERGCAPRWTASGRSAWGSTRTRPCWRSGA